MKWRGCRFDVLIRQFHGAMLPLGGPENSVASLFTRDLDSQSSSCVVGDLRFKGGKEMRSEFGYIDGPGSEFNRNFSVRSKRFSHRQCRWKQDRHPVTDHSDTPGASSEVLLHERDLQRGLECGNWIESVISECCLQVRQGDLSRLGRRGVRRPTQVEKRSADCRLGFQKSSPNAIRCGPAKPALEASKCLGLVAAGYDLFQEGP